MPTNQPVLLSVLVCHPKTEFNPKNGELSNTHTKLISESSARCLEAFERNAVRLRGAKVKTQTGCVVVVFVSFHCRHCSNEVCEEKFNYSSRTATSRVQWWNGSKRVICQFSPVSVASSSPSNTLDTSIQNESDASFPR